MRDAFCNVQLMPTTTLTTVTTKQPSAVTTTPPTLISSNFGVLLHNNNKTSTSPPSSTITLAATVLTPTPTSITSINSNMTNICSSDSFTIIPPPHHDMLSANSIELNAAASLSDDSGVPLTTNSSISSGDSYRLGMCKLEIEMGESDGEVSQFDSLDNCSEGGMSAENFNTLKKGPLAPIDPPPEFQDSPHTTLVRSISKNIFNSLRRWTSSQSSFEHLKDHSGEENGLDASELLLPLKIIDNQQQTQQLFNNPLELLSYQQQTTNLCSGSGSGNSIGVGNGCKADLAHITIQDYSESNKCLRDAYAINKHLYSSDSILNSHTENIYDEPNNVGSNSLGNSVDVFEETEVCASPPLPPPPPPVSIVKIKQTLCPYYQDHTRYFKAIPSEQDYITSAAQRFDLSGLSEIHDYDLYYGSSRRNTYHQQYDTYLQRKLLSPLNLTTLHHCHHHGHYYAGVNSYSNRPNSRNSLNSRLSSSYNSLSMSSSNKPDDSIFITQAMSHDALLTREISDFYNVPIDSDIYAFPVDMIQQHTDKECQRRHILNNHNNNNIHMKNKQNDKLYKIHDMMATKTATSASHDDFGLGIEHSRSQHNKLARRINRQKRKKRAHANCAEDTDDGGRQLRSSISTCSSGKYRTPVHCAQIVQDHTGSDDNGLLSDEVATITTTITTNAISSCSGNNMNHHEPLHMTLDEVKQFYHTLYSDGLSTTTTTMTMTRTQRNSTSATLLQRVQQCNKSNVTKSSNETIWSSSSTHSRTKNAINNNNNNNNNNQNMNGNVNNKQLSKAKQKLSETNNNFNCINNHNHSSHGSSTIEEHKQGQHQQQQQQQQHESGKKSQFTLNLKQKFCSIFRFRKNYRSCRSNSCASEIEENANNRLVSEDKRKKFQSRALPPLPKKADSNALASGVVDNVDGGIIAGTMEAIVDASPTAVALPKRSETRAFQFTSSIEKVKDYGWYWGPLSSEAAEKVLSNEPDGSFIVRDSSDDHYIFSLSFKLNNCVRHVRIEQDQGTFSFGSYAKFKSQTITEFIEKAVEHSRSGRYLFFLHRRPEHGPMRVQLTNPVSRFKHVQSLQHMCRFVILKTVIRKDLIQTLPLPRRLLDYLNYKHCYSEQVESDSAHSQTSGDGSI